MKKIFLLIAVGLIILITVLSLKNCSNSGAIEVTVEEVKSKNIIETVSANGKIQPEVEVK